MIRKTLRGILKENLSDEELTFILKGIQDDISINRLYHAKPKKTSISHIIRMGIILHCIWVSSQDEKINHQECSLSFNKDSKNVFVGNLTS